MNYKGIACVTGASGVIGKKLVKKLLSNGWQVRALTRKNRKFDAGVDVFVGDLYDEKSLNAFTRNADILFHCAAELKDQSKMWEVNLEGTRRIISAIAESNIRYFCYMSSAGVVGNVSEAIVDESIKCNPYNDYEKSKFAAENIVAKGINNCHVVMIRPTNVVDEENLGVMSIVKRGKLNNLKLFIKGGERSHVVSADDVAAAAVHLMQYKTDTPECYFISCDHEPMNTYAGINRLYRSYKADTALHHVQKSPHLPIRVTHLIRRLFRGKSNRGDICYSSNKLLSTGFRFENSLKDLVKKIAKNT